MTSPRLQITLDPASYAAVKRMATASRQSMSSVVADIVEEAAPLLVRLAVSIEAAAQAQDDVRRDLLAVLNAEAPRMQAAARSAYEGIAAVEKAAARTGRGDGRMRPAPPSPRAVIRRRRRPAPGQ